MSRKDVEKSTVHLTAIDKIEQAIQNGATTLDLSGHVIRWAPESLGSLTNLQRLDLSCTLLSTLPESIGNLANLRELNLAHNQLTTIPESLGRLTNLVSINLNGNPLNPELSAANYQGSRAVIEYLRATAQSHIALNEGKLIIVGEGGVGKSCLLDALRGEPWKEHVSTHGIEVHPIEVTAPDGRNITLNCWDFGGQEIYRPTHQLFFSAPAVYLVVWKPREGSKQGMIREWIKLILHREPSAKILVVATHGGPDHRRPDISPHELRELFGSETILGFLHVENEPDSNGDRHGIDKLRVTIGKVASDIPAMCRTIPTKWVSARYTLANRPEAYLPYSEFARICREMHGMDDNETSLFGRIAHELGDLIHYHTDSALKDIVVLKPNWLAKAISFILADEKIRKEHGLADHEYLSKIWSTPPLKGEAGYPVDLHPIFRRLMEKFDLIYPVVFAGFLSNTSLVAQLVDYDRPTLFPRWDAKPGAGDTEQQQVCRIVDEKGQSATAAGLFYQLIVRLHKFSLGRKNYVESLHWQRGLMVDDDYNGRGLLEHLGNDVRITVRAVYPTQFLGFLTTEVKSLVESFWRGIRCEVMVPCVHPCGKKEPGLGLFEVEKLTKSKKNGQPTYPCSVSNCDQWQSIDCLLQNAPSKVADTRRELFDRFDEVKAELTAIYNLVRIQGTEVQLGFKALDEGQKALLSRVDEQFDGLLRTMLDEAKDGPRLFSFEAVDYSIWNVTGWLKQKFRLRLWCERSRLPLQNVDDENGKGVYVLELPREWVKSAAPYLKFLSTTLSLVLPVAASAAKLMIEDKVYKTIEKELEFGHKCADSFLKAGDKIGDAMMKSDELPDLDPITGRSRAQGGVLRQLHSFLKEKDPSFGGLVRVQNKRREFLWVHPNFADEY